MVNRLETAIAPIAEFKEHYGQRVLEGLEAVTLEALIPAARAIERAVVEPRSTIYVFGNGGSYAIGEHFGLTLKQRFRGSGIRIRQGISVLESQARALESGYNKIFEEILKQERADTRDLVVLLSGSGDSNNIITAAKYCNEQGIPLFSFSGFSGGEIAKVSRMPFIVPIHDQQMCEDVMQALLHQLVEQAFLMHQKSEGFVEYREQYKKQIVRALDRIEPALLYAMSRSITTAFYSGNNIFLIASEGDGPGISAEHTAHNLNWDAVFGVKNPPARYIFSTPTHCDYSGIGNDRVAEGIVSMQQLEKARKGDVLVLFAQDSNSRGVENTRKYAQDKAMTVYVLCGKGAGDVCYKTKEAYVTADVMQITGHMIGRIIRNMLRDSLTTECLITEDLAQRRLRGERHGL